MGGDEAALHQIAALNEALTLTVSLLRVAVGAVRSKADGTALSFTCCARLEGVPNARRKRAARDAGNARTTTIPACCSFGRSPIPAAQIDH